MTREDYRDMTEVSVPNAAFTEGPHVQWNHIDGPLMSWAAHIHWLTWEERLRIFLRLTSIDELACERWPYTAMRRQEILEGLEDQP